MKITIIEDNGVNFALVESDKIAVASEQEALDLLANSGYQDAFRIIIKKEQLHPDFFNLKTGLAGAILQKFSTYKVQLAVVGDFSEYISKSLRDFIYESNKGGRIIFVESVEEAKIRLRKGM